MSLVQKLNFAVRGDERGFLVPIEANRTVPFEIKRVYYLYATKPDVRRGLHAHIKLRQAAVCVHGCCSLLLDDGHKQEIIQLDDPSQGILIESMVWHEIFDFSQDAVLLVFADGYYDESDYIRARKEFDRLIQKIS